MALALSAGKDVSIERLASIVWGDEAPAHVRRATQTCLTRLRKLLGPGAIATSPAGYRLDVAPERVDAILFERLLEAAAGSSDPADERAALARALALWRGLPFDGLRSAWLEGAEATRLTERRVAAHERRVELDLNSGLGAELVAELRDLTARYPLRERLWGHLMMALHVSGQRADALTTYQRLYRLLSEELGIEPGHAVQELHRRILTARAESPPPLSQQTITVPRQLPADVSGFTGREDELARLDRLPDMNAVVITSIGGMAGIGKTSLAVHIAHRMAGRYPDGQLFIDLHGYTQGLQPIEPADALGHLLRSLDVGEERVPPGLEDRAALYRTRLADRRMLILLDNAAAESQVMPLLPGAPGCLVLVTSRRRLAGLDQTHTLSLDTLPVSDAVRLFTRAAGDRSLGDSPRELLVELVELCGRLPLAIRIAAGRFRSHRTWDLSHLVERLRDQQRRLGELEAGQRSVTSALGLSYQYLSAEQRQMYRLLGLHSGPDIDQYAAAALIDATAPVAGRLLEHLHEAHLLQEPVAGRYRFHDLTRVHAARTAMSEETSGSRRQALGRVIDYYRYAAALAVDAAHPYEHERRAQVPPTLTPLAGLSGMASALDWLDLELPNLLAAARCGAELDRPSHLLHLSSILHRHLRSRGRYHDGVNLHQQAMTTARALGHQEAELDSLVSLGHIYLRQGRFAQAVDQLQKAVIAARALGHHEAEVEALHNLGWVHMSSGRYEQAIDNLEQALNVAHSTDYRRGEMLALSALGHVHRREGRYTLAAGHFGRTLRLAHATGDDAIEAALAGLGELHRRQGRYEQSGDHYRRLFDLAQDRGDRNWQVEARQGLGRLHHTAGDPRVALDLHDQVLALATEIGQPADQARAHDGLAYAHHDLGDHERARTHWQHALDILDELGTAWTDDKETAAPIIRTRLRALSPAIRGH
ncbi:BTAD domain-containing putative transcriptional regulator [Actinoplanes sp. NPDC051633]|uniref:AfsR/SARP family transcriptional regulator n=1 Tax=Actinoplanes sp. NPDC051633 TaxID=3155670 RepID=UPI003448BE8A